MSRRVSHEAWLQRPRLFCTERILRSHGAGRHCAWASDRGARKNSPYLIRDAQVRQVKRLSELQWNYVLETVQSLSSERPEYERTLFIFACLKALYLRVSELSDRPQWTPVWERIWKDYEGKWWLKHFGKDRKIRDVSISEEMWSF